MIFRVMLRKEILEQWRSYRILIVSLVFIFCGLLAPLTARYFPEFFKLMPNGEKLLEVIPPPNFGEAIAQYVKNFNQFGFILVLFMTMSVIVHEKERGTAALVLVKPVPRSVFVVAKFVATGLTFALGILLAAISGYIYTALLFQPIELGPWVVLNLMALVLMLVYIALTLFASAVSPSTTVAGALSFVILVVVSLLGSIPQVAEYFSTRLMMWGAQLVTHSGSGDAPWAALAVSVALIAGAVLGAWLVFRRQEI